MLYCSINIPRLHFDSFIAVYEGSMPFEAMHHARSESQ